MPNPIRYNLGWRVNFEHPPGIRHRVRFQNKHYTDAKTGAQDYIDRICTGQAVYSIDIETAISEYLRWAERTGQKRANTAASQSGRLRIFLRWAQGRGLRTVRQINRNIMREFQGYFFDNYPFYTSSRRALVLNYPDVGRRRRATWEHYRVNLSAFFGNLVEHELIESNPIAGVKEFKIKREETVPRWFTDEELAAIWTYADEHETDVVRVWFRLLPCTGLRLSEAMNLRWADVDLQSQRITIKQTKSYRTRTIPIVDSLVSWLKRLPVTEPTDYVFGKTNGEPYYSKDSWYKRLQKALGACGIRQAGLHAFRHSFATGLARSGAHPREIQELLGHSTINMAMRYAHAYSGQLRRSVEKLPFNTLA